MKIPALILLVVSCLPSVAGDRLWRNHDGSSSFSGSLESREGDQVTIRRSDGESFTLALDRLHPDDRAWLDRQEPEADHATDATDAGDPADAANDGAIFETLAFGDDRRTVEKKLLASEGFEASAEAAHLGRLGLNGTFRTRRPIGGMHAELFFDWDAQGGLREINLQTPGSPAGEYETSLKSVWTEFEKLLCKVHGKPSRQTSYPNIDSLEDQMILHSHVWTPKSGGSAMLGVGRQDARYSVVVRLTREDPLSGG